MLGARCRWLRGRGGGGVGGARTHTYTGIRGCCCCSGGAAGIGQGRRLRAAARAVCGRWQFCARPPEVSGVGGWSKGRAHLDRAATGLTTRLAAGPRAVPRHMAALMPLACRRLAVDMSLAFLWWWWACLSLETARTPPTEESLIWGSGGGVSGDLRGPASLVLSIGSVVGSLFRCPELCAQWAVPTVNVPSDRRGNCCRDQRERGTTAVLRNVLHRRLSCFSLAQTLPHPPGFAER